MEALNSFKPIRVLHNGTYYTITVTSVSRHNPASNHKRRPSRERSELIEQRILMTKPTDRLTTSQTPRKKRWSLKGTSPCLRKLRRRGLCISPRESESSVLPRIARHGSAPSRSVPFFPRWIEYAQGHNHHRPVMPIVGKFKCERGG